MVLPQERNAAFTIPQTAVSFFGKQLSSSHHFLSFLRMLPQFPFSHLKFPG